MTWPRAESQGTQVFQLISARPLTSDTPTTRSGTPIQTYADPVSVTGVSFQPAVGVSSTEAFTPIADQVVTRWLLIAPADLVMTAFDRARYAGILAADGSPALLQVDGEPVLFPDADGQPDHVEAHFKRVEG